MKNKGIIKDSMKILAFIYKKGKTNSNEILQESKFEKGRVMGAVKFLSREGL